ncbi:MAG: hypothetical protein C0626_05875 [Arcobacter sp.]|uniref:hypothetical protein n=1 Tax=uncultured Arcobacter sp. TaxID=165434 RepID=UPI000CB9A884|nr:hypothetical protein [uncultured Arcobacter sp.]PLY10502.1 MAG: hypothetical protein C0626_05875 [Arcobacter sp.]
MQSDNIELFENFIDFKRFPNVEEDSYKIAKNWYKKNGIDYTLYNGMSIGNILAFDIYKMNVENIKFILFLISNNLINSSNILNIYISKSYVLDSTILNLVEVLNIRHKIIQSQKEINQFNFVTYQKSSAFEEGKIKNIIKKTLKNINNILKYNRKEKVFIETYHSTYEVVSNLSNKFISNRFFGKNLLSLYKPLYVSYEDTYETILTDKTKLKNIVNYDFNSIIEVIYEKSYDENKLKTIALIDKVVNSIEKNLITKAIFVREVSKLATIFFEYYKSKRFGKIYIWEHGFRDFSRYDNELCEKVDEVFAWGEYDYSKYLANDLKLKVHKVGYPQFLENSIKGSKRLFNLGKSKVLVLSPTGFSSFVTVSQNKQVKILLDIVGILNQCGVKNDDILIKIHPGNMNQLFFQEILSGKISHQNILKDVSIYKAIDMVDLVIGEASTVIYESSFSNVNYLCINWQSQVAKDTIFNENFVKTIYNVEDLKDVLKYQKFQDIETFKKKTIYNHSNIEVTNFLKNL